MFITLASTKILFWLPLFLSLWQLKVPICISDRYMIHLYCLAVHTGFYSDMVECWSVTQAAVIDPRLRHWWLELFYLLHLESNLNSPIWWAWWPNRLGDLVLIGCSNWNSRTNLKLEGGIRSSGWYMMHLYCLAIQAGFYSDIVEFF